MQSLHESSENSILIKREHAASNCFAPKDLVNRRFFLKMFLSCVKFQVKILLKRLRCDMTNSFQKDQIGTTGGGESIYVTNGWT